MNDLKFLMKFAGIPSYDRMIAALTGGAGAVAGGGVAIADFNAEIAEQAAKDAQQDLAIGQMSGRIIELGGKQVSYFIDAVSGNDDNDGLSAQTPVASFRALFAKMSFANANRIFIMSDVVIDEPNADNIYQYASLYIDGYNGESHDIIFKGASGWNFAGGASLEIVRVRTISDKATAGYCITVAKAGGVSYVLGEIDRTQAAIDGPNFAVFSLSAFVDFNRNATLIGAGAQGKVILRRALQAN